MADEYRIIEGPYDPITCERRYKLQRRVTHRFLFWRWAAWKNCTLIWLDDRWDRLDKWRADLNIVEEVRHGG